MLLLSRAGTVFLKLYALYLGERPDRTVAGQETVSVTEARSI
jgi:hypothetical protein